ncbi:MAG: integrase arm-type DNA-binding domain-containing protein [Proteobacteria bacterium]|nr:integrase arm-type DNA-binding domain-containing protein [Pseudomonadota bacterium]
MRYRQIYGIFDGILKAIKIRYRHGGDMALTDTFIKQTKHTGKPAGDKYADGGGMYLLINATGKYWRMDYRFGDKRKTLALGVYPAVSLAKARERRDKAREQLAEGIDPSQAKRKNKQAAIDAAANTFEKLAREWHASRLDTWRESTARDTLRRFERDIFPEIGAMPIGSIEPKHMTAALLKIQSRGAGETAHRLKANCVRVFNYAHQKGIENNSPADRLTDVLKPPKKGHFAAITSDELPAFLAALDNFDEHLYIPTRIAMRLMLLVFVRTSELITTPWSEIDIETGEWIIPWKRMKRGKRVMNPDEKDHHVSLSKQALALLRELHEVTGSGKYLFPNQRDHNEPMSNGAILMALYRMGYRGKMTGHGFRALAMSTLTERLGYEEKTVKRQLSHAEKDKVTRAYDRAQFLAVRKKMLQDWADYLDKLRKGADVIQFKTK